MSIKDKLSKLKAKYKSSRVLVFISVSVACLIVIVMFSSFNRSDWENVPATKEVVSRPISVHSVSPDSYQPMITAMGEVSPLWQVSIKAQVDGQIIYLSKRLQAGNNVSKGEVLARIEKSSYEMQVADARSRLENAKLNLLAEQNEANEARKNWNRSGLEGDPESPLVLREPQLAVAKAEVEASQAAYDYARKLLTYAEIKAPFDGVIISRSANPGETIFAGDVIASIYGMETVEICVHLDDDQWSLLPDSIVGTEATLNPSQQDGVWKASVVREEQRIRSDSRLRAVYLEVNNPLQQSPPLLPGTFVKANIAGKQKDNLLQLPETSLTKESIVWFVDKENQLLPQRCIPVSYHDGDVYINAPELDQWPMTVAIAPNSGFVRGLTVQPITTTKER